MAPRCPDCATRIRARDVDFARDQATCRHCRRTMAYSALPGVVDNAAMQRVLGRLGPPGGMGGPGTDRAPAPLPNPRHHPPAPSLAQPSPAPNPYATPLPARGTRGAAGAPVRIDPPAGLAGVWHARLGDRDEIGATNRSIAGALGATFIAVFWCSITGVFVVVGVAGVLGALGLVNGAAVGGPGLGFSLFMLLFVTPFVAIGLWLLWTALLFWGGREVVTIRGDAAEHFSGIGPVGFRKRFAASAVTRVAEDVKVSHGKNGTTTTRTVAIHTDAPKPIKFGACLNAARRGWMIRALQQALVPRA
ncbi:MAG: hypothetical protein KDA05_03525 [Phycisphaerales bacterium]|nr:hypothetical protein [Phycisphaerales bacterium]MCB9840127.1 hypothetical protein [Phycisphaeraceae bacterium]